MDHSSEPFLPCLSMVLPVWLENTLTGTCNQIYALGNQPIPEKNLLESCRIISHRGIHDNRQIPENTLAAFDRALAVEGIWGIELDFRWTRDLVPVVFHDQNLVRIFGDPSRICELDFAFLHDHFPLVPSLEEVVKKYGGRLHLMLEAKEEYYPDPVAQNRILSSILAMLQPVVDFHLISLAHGMLEIIDFLEPDAKVLVAQMNEKELSRLALKHSYAGIAGHYVLITRKLVERHLQAGQSLGTGYPHSKNCLFRELNRGIDWIFSSHAEELARIRNKALSEL